MKYLGLVKALLSKMPKPASPKDGTKCPNGKGSGKNGKREMKNNRMFWDNLSLPWLRTLKSTAIFILVIGITKMLYDVCFKGIPRHTGLETILADILIILFSGLCVSAIAQVKASWVCRALRYMAVVLFIIIFILVSLMRMSDLDCDMELFSTEISPMGDWFGLVKSEQCGWSIFSPVNYTVTLETADTVYRKVVLRFYGEPHPKIEWQSDRQLIVHFCKPMAAEDILNQLPLYEDVAIKYDNSLCK